MDPLDLLRNLMVMAMADGELSEEEMALLEERRQLWRIEQKDFDEALRFAQSSSGRLQLPDEPHARHDLLYDLVAMMSADGRFDNMELQFLALAAARMEVPPGDLDQILDEFNQDDDLLLGDDI